MGISIPNYAKPDTNKFTLLIADVRGEFAIGQEAVTASPAAADDSIPLPVGPIAVTEKLISRPAYGLKIKYRWNAKPLDKDYSIFVQILDKSGKTMLQDDHQPPTKTTAWTGTVEYERTVFLPAQSPNGQRTLPGMGEGVYTIYTGLQVERSRKVLRETSIKPDTERRYAIGTLTLDNAAPLPELPPVTLNLAGYKMTFNDEFDGPLSVSALGPIGEGGRKWIAHTPYKGDFGDAKFADPTPEFPLRVKDGILRIEVRKDKDRRRGGPLSSVDTEGRGFSQTYGYWEMRAKLPVGPGTWPAFWLNAFKRVTQAGDMKLTHVEIDTLEQYGHWPNKLCTAIHHWPQNGKGAIHDGKNFIVTGMTEDFHTYGVLTTPEHIVFYYDGRELRRADMPPYGREPYYVMVNLTLGPGWPLDKTPSPSEMLGDYVRVYAKERVIGRYADFQRNIARFDDY